MRPLATFQQGRLGLNRAFFVSREGQVCFGNVSEGFRGLFRESLVCLALALGSALSEDFLFGHGIDPLHSKDARFCSKNAMSSMPFPTEPRNFFMEMMRTEPT